MRIAFHGANASTFAPGFAELLEAPHEIAVLSDELAGPGEAEAFTAAEVVIGVRLTPAMPQAAARLYQVAGAGTDGIDLAALPPGCALCNVYGHEPAIAEYVFAALLARHVPLAEADAQLRRGDWHYWAGKPTGLRSELGAQTLGIVGFGHIGRAVAARAAAFGLRLEVANRSPLAGGPAVARAWPLDRLAEMAAGLDVLLNTLPLTPETRGLIGAPELAALPPRALVMNVGRGAVIEEEALYRALAGRRIAGAILDTWYVYPDAANPAPLPSSLPFHELPNVVMTPHMSGWTQGTIDRRRAAMAENVNRLARGEALLNRLR
ncbi:Phosphoglycerate dehydrogenase [Tistlia consotensis]|uniref:Phosphoglycerate dehydrogenase n=1 Tax=Tistlia consotensis USBA 355 TaxID=560819 RepID=A0A1Y6B4A4_9PROT|nr:2-hydroxyacid dehydrogenase [Tistlia consotensis]SME91176.1 Phosphoglycerate dehydrogenase [Tistlia consotensis USBA 355]SNR27182.1 Phosphoglycerate dehydrogenase [Tistlia consotensis]